MSSSSYLIKTQARSLVAHAADEDNHGFLVGTANLKGANEIRLLRYFEDDEAIECAAVYAHPHEIASMAACPFDGALVTTVHNAVPGMKATVWRMPGLPGAADDEGRNDSPADSFAGNPPKDLVLVAELAELADPNAPAGSKLLHVQWLFARESSGTARLISVDESRARIWDLAGSGAASSGPASVAASGNFSTGDASFLGGVAWDPHHANEVAIATDSSVHCWDTRTAEKMRTLEYAVPAGACVRALSYNPNKPWHLATAGDDFRVKLWDMRKLGRPAKILDGHTFWATTVAFNPFHDQLVISGGGDGRVNLWRVSSVSSAPLLELGDEEIDPDTGKRAEPKLAPDSAIRTHDDHDDTVCAAAWSSHSAWVYASLSYPGKVVVCQVPSAEKYRVLL